MKLIQDGPDGDIEFPLDEVSVTSNAEGMSFSGSIATSSLVSNGLWTGSGTGTGGAGTYVPQPLFGTPQPYQSVPTYTVGPCDTLGHEIEGEYIEYVGGKVVGYCSACNQRILLEKVPGGIAMLRVKALLGTVMGYEPDEVQSDEFNLGELLSEFVQIRDIVEEAEFSLAEARKLLDLTKKCLDTKLSA